MCFEVVDVGDRLVAGRVVRTSNAVEMDVQQARIPGLWNRARRVDAMVAVLTDYESDRAGEFTQLVGREIDRIEDAHADELIAQLPAASYALFRTSGEVPGCIVDGWRRVWAEEDAGRLRRAWRTDFELWSAGESPQIFISIL